MHVHAACCSRPFDFDHSLRVQCVPTLHFACYDMVCGMRGRCDDGCYRELNLRDVSALRRSRPSAAYIRFTTAAAVVVIASYNINLLLIVVRRTMPERGWYLSLIHI